MDKLEEFAFTVKQLGRQNAMAVPSTYEPIFDKWSTMGCHVVLKQFETDPRGVCHFHGILSMPTGLYRKRLTMTGFHMYMERIYDRQGWHKYCVKQNLIQTDYDTTHPTVYRVSPRPLTRPSKSLFRNDSIKKITTRTEIHDEYYEEESDEEPNIDQYYRMPTRKLFI